MSNTKNLYKKALEPNHGGPAFPRVGHSHPQDIEPEQWIKGNEGMTLRDYFAAKAMQGWLSTFVEASSVFPTGYSAEAVARSCYMLADEMLKAREQ